MRIRFRMVQPAGQRLRWPGLYVGALALGLVLGSLSTPTLAQETAPVDRAHHEGETLPVAGQAPGEEKDESEPKGVFDKPIKVKGITLLFGGFAKVDFIQDFDPIGNEDQFKVNSIPVEGDPDAELGGSTNISARQTRFTLDMKADESLGGVHAYVEGDFFGSGNSFRLRHGYGEWKGLLGGQTWTTFQDITARPFTLDYEGPDSEFFVRQAMIRYTGTPSERLEWSIAVEDPDSQVTIDDDVSASGRSDMPDVPARVKFKPSWGHVQVAAILRQLRVVSDGGALDESTTGWGLNLSGKAKLGSHTAIMGHVGTGSGVSRYIESFGGTSSDAVLTPSGELEALDSFATVLGIEHHWNDKFRSTLAGGVAELDDSPYLTGDAIKSAQSVHANLVYAPNRLINLGGELMWGERENMNGAKGDATRFQFSIQYKFR